MTANGWAQIALFVALVAACTVPVGKYLVAVYEGRLRWLAPVERATYRLLGVNPDDDQRWTTYAAGVLVFSFVSLVPVYLLLRLQHALPFNPQRFGAIPARQAFETAASFTTNTNWQSYAGESTLSYLSQMAALAMQNFASAAVGMAVAVALVRGIARKGGGHIGNVWADIVRGTLYVFIPGSIALALVMVQQGVIQNLSPYAVIHTLEGATQTLALGPVASQEAIKQLGTNGGGFFNANAAHPFENPTPLTNLLSMLAIFVIPAGATWMFGRMVRNQRHGWALFAAMFTLFAAGTVITYRAESAGNPIHAARGIDVVTTATNPGGNMEGKEVRFGIANSALYAVVTTDASCGAVNAMHDSFTPLGGMVPLVNMQLGELIFGGVGSGLYGMLIMVVLTVFIAGLMVGRTPEYLGKKIQSREIRMVMLYVLAYPLAVLPFAAVAAVSHAGLAGLNNAGPHGFTEILYAFSSAAGNNGSAFAGLTGTTAFYNTLLGIGTLVGRFALIVPALALAGFLSERAPVATDASSFPVTTPLFVTLLIGVILIVGALTFFPALALGPIVEHLLVAAGQVF